MLSASWCGDDVKQDIIKIRNLTYRYSDRSKPALQSIDLSIEKGEFALLTGASGSGKSTLVLAIAAVLFSQFEGQASGEVIVDGMDMRRTPIFRAADYVGLVQQNPETQFCTLNVVDELAFGLENRCLPVDEIRTRIEWALGVVGASHLIDRELVTLSGGEKQKIAIAAVMAARPQVLILDEPTSNLDPSATTDILRVIADLRRSDGLTVIVIEHKLIDPAGDEIHQVHLDHGRVVYDGPMDADRMLWRFDEAVPAPAATEVLTEPMVKVRDLTVCYDENPAIQGISLDLARGEFIAVMGDNGSGKTTFLQALLGLVKPAHGSVEVLGYDTRVTSVSDLARKVAFIFQNPDHQLFAGSVWEEAMLAATNFGMLDEHLRAETGSWLARCGLQDRHEDHPYKLSYGEKRRLNLVSMLNYDPHLILLDEILIGQDHENARFLLNLLAERVLQGATVVLVNHSPVVTAVYTQRLLFFQNGMLTLDAPIPEAFQQLELNGFNQYSMNANELSVMGKGLEA
jgi:energy-coupling factor transporter ATP-binding protein EcfA2